MSSSSHSPGVVGDISDAALMGRLADGDASALGPIHQRHARAVGSLLLRLEPEMTPEQADDLSQEVFLTLFETAGRYRHEDKLRSWLFGIAVRKARGWQRRVWSRRSLLRRGHLEQPGLSARRESGLDDQLVARQEVGRALAALPPKQREVLVLSVVEELSGSEVSRILGIRENAVWVRLHRARKNVRGVLEEKGETRP